MAAEVSKEEMDYINAECQKEFGIIQAQSVWPTVDDWMAYIQQCGFMVEYWEEAGKGPRVGRASGKEMWSKGFSYLGRFFNAFNTQHRRESQGIRDTSARLFTADKAYLNSYVLRLRKAP